MNPSLGVLLTSLMCLSGSPGESVSTPLGCQVGAEIPSFYVRQVTTDRPNLATCLVCRYGARPVVLLCVRQLDGQVEKLIAAVDRTVDQRRGRGLRGFAISLLPDVRQAQPKFMTLTRREMLSLPLTFPVEAGGPRSLELPDDALVTVLCYQRKRIVSRHIFEPGELTDHAVEQVVAAVRELAEPTENLCR